MRDLVFAMAHSLVAQTKRDYQLIAEHCRPELNVGGVLGRTPAMVAALSNPPRHRALDVDAPKILLTRYARDHAKIETPAGVTPRSDTHMRVERVVDVGCFACDLAYAVEHIGAALDAVPITDHRKNIFGAADESERVRARCAEDGHAGAVRHRAPGEFARELAPAPLGSGGGAAARHSIAVPPADGGRHGDGVSRLRVLGREAASGGLTPQLRAARGDLAPRDALESRLRVRDVDVGREPQSAQGVVPHRYAPVHPLAALLHASSRPHLAMKSRFGL